MKFLIIQENGRHPVSKHLRECNSLRRALIFHGEECTVWGLGHDNFNSTPDFNTYDVIINLENYDVGWVPDLATISKPIKLLWSIDSHFQGKSYYENIFHKGKYTKRLESTKYYLDQNSIWFPNCYDSDFIVPLEDIKKDIFIGFCGNILNRGFIFSKLKSIFPDFKIDIDIRGINMIRTINSYYIHFNKNISNDINYRNFETMGCGTLLLADHNDQYDDLGFIDGDNFYSYHTLDEAVEKIKYLKTAPEVIKKIALKGHSFVLENHTYKKRAKTLLGIIKSL